MPIKDKDDGPVVEFFQTGEVALDKKVSQHRRKIIKASAAVVPAIMTIRSGAAVAMASIHQCKAKDAARTIPEDKLVLGDDEPFAHDEWVRVQGRAVKHGNKTYYCVEKGAGEWDCFGAGGSTDTPQGNWATNDYITDNAHGTDVYLLAYVDTESGIYTWHPQNGVYLDDALVSGSQITGSCLCSVNPDMADLF